MGLKVEENEERHDDIDKDESAEDGASGAEERLRRASDAVKKAFSSGFRTVRLNEERLRGLVNDVVVKESLSYLKSAIDRGQEELVRMVGGQTRRFIEGIDVGNEIAKILTAISFEVRTEVRFIPNDKKVKPDIKVRAKVKKGDSKPSEGTE